MTSRAAGAKNSLRPTDASLDLAAGSAGGHDPDCPLPTIESQIRFLKERFEMSREHALVNLGNGPALLISAQEMIYFGSTIQVLELLEEIRQSENLTSHEKWEEAERILDQRTIH